MERKWILGGLFVDTVEVTSTQTSLLMESEVISENVSQKVAQLFVEELGATEILISEEPIVKPATEEEPEKQVLSWVVSWEYDKTLKCPMLIPTEKLPKN